MTLPRPPIRSPRAPARAGVRWPRFRAGDAGAGGLAGGAVVSELQTLIAACEHGDPVTQRVLIERAAKLACFGQHYDYVVRLLNNDAFFEAAISLLQPGQVWRKYTDRCFTVYGASPYNAAAQERFDGYGDCDPLTLTAAFLRMRFAKELATQASTKSQPATGAPQRLAPTVAAEVADRDEGEGR